jgi:hypothetical protein
MTPFETLVFLRHRLATAVPIFTALAAPPVMPLCPACTAALLAELAALCPDAPPDKPLTLHGSRLVGYTFREATPAQCGLHPYVQEEVVCR